MFGGCELLMFILSNLHEETVLMDSEQETLYYTVDYTCMYRLYEQNHVQNVLIMS